MYSLTWTEIDVNDLHDEFIVNIDRDFWEFINEDVETAYYLGLHFNKWFLELNDINKQYLYSVGARHVGEDLDTYQSQIDYWDDVYCKEHNSDIIDIIDLHEYILNNIIFQPEDDELIVNLAFCLGLTASKELFKKEDMKESKQELFICECGDPQHQFIVDYDPDFGTFIEVLLNPNHNIFKRIWIAIKYIFGHKSIYGAFDEVILKPEDIDRLCEILKRGQNNTQTEGLDI